MCVCIYISYIDPYSRGWAACTRGKVVLEESSCKHMRRNATKNVTVPCGPSPRSRQRQGETSKLMFSQAISSMGTSLMGNFSSFFVLPFFFFPQNKVWEGGHVI